MKTFRYIAIDDSGQSRTGKVKATSVDACRALLKQKHLTLIESKELSSVLGLSNLGGLNRLFALKLNETELSLLFRQLATLINAGVPLLEAIRSVNSQADQQKDRQLLSHCESELLEGTSFSAALKGADMGVPEDVCAAISVAEESGALGDVLTRLAEEQEHRSDNKRALLGAILYPSLLVTTSIAVMIFVMTNIVPKVVAVFDKQRSELPQVTKVVIAISDFFVHYGFVLLILLVGLLLLLSVLNSLPKYRLLLHRQLLLLPFIGTIIKLSALADWSRHLAMMLSSGVPVIKSMRIANNTIGNLSLKKQLDDALYQVDRGENLHVALAEQPDIPGFMLHLISSGEMSSSLVDMLNRISDFYSRMLRAKTDIFLKVLNPVLLIFIAIVISVIILGVITPIMQMNSMV